MSENLEERVKLLENLVEALVFKAVGTIAIGDEGENDTTISSSQCLHSGNLLYDMVRTKLTNRFYEREHKNTLRKLNVLEHQFPHLKEKREKLTK